MSASMSPTRWPARASATARFAETVDFPTPPLPDEMASTVPRWGSSTGVGGGGTPPGPVRGAGWRGATPSAALLASVTLTRTPVTPCTPWTAFRTSRASEPGSSRPSRNVNVTIPSPATTRSFTMPAEKMSFPLRVLELGQCALDARLESVGGGHGRKVLERRVLQQLDVDLHRAGVRLHADSLIHAVHPTQVVFSDRRADEAQHV